MEKMHCHQISDIKWAATINVGLKWSEDLGGRVQPRTGQRDGHDGQARGSILSVRTEFINTIIDNVLACDWRNCACGRHCVGVKVKAAKDTPVVVLAGGVVITT